MNWFDRLAWDLICKKISDKCSYGVLKSRVSSCYGSTPTALTRRLITFGGRGCGKTLTMKFIANQINELYNKRISVRWCESFEILDDRGRYLRTVYMAKI